MTFSDLDEAFQELERRADTASDLIRASGRRDPHQRQSSRRLPGGGRAAAIVATAAAVAAVAVGIDLASGSGSHHAAGGGSPTTHSVSTSARTPTAPSAARHSTAASSARHSTVAATDVPKTQAALIARFRSILGDTATFTVDTANSTDSMITGVLTSASGSRGMYVLELDKDVALCGATSKIGQLPRPLPCPHLTRLADGSRLEVDPNFADGPTDGVMNDALLNRSDGWQISLYTANVQGKYYGAPILGKEPALTIKQVVAVVTSPQWLAK